MTHSTTYTQHLQSSRWAEIRRAKKLEANYRCQRCGVRERILGPPHEVHHLHYDSLGEENLEDLKVVCRACHKLEDHERAERTEDRVWDARVDGYGRKRWGENWEMYHEWWEAEEALEEWLDKSDAW